MKEKYILVVDDEISIIEIWNELLCFMGHQVSTAQNGDAAVSLIKKQHFDLIITDMKMPGSDGLVVLEYVSKIEKKPKVIVSSGFVEYQNIAENYNIEKIITKPFVLEDEMLFIEKILST